MPTPGAPNLESLPPIEAKEQRFGIADELAVIASTVPDPNIQSKAQSYSTEVRMAEKEQNSEKMSTIADQLKMETAPQLQNMEGKLREQANAVKKLTDALSVREERVKFLKSQASLREDLATSIDRHPTIEEIDSIVREVNPLQDLNETQREIRTRIRDSQISALQEVHAKIEEQNIGPFEKVFRQIKEYVMKIDPKILKIFRKILGVGTLGFAGEFLDPIIDLSSTRRTMKRFFPSSYTESPNDENNIATLRAQYRKTLEREGKQETDYSFEKFIDERIERLRLERSDRNAAVMIASLVANEQPEEKKPEKEKTNDDKAKDRAQENIDNPELVKKRMLLAFARGFLQVKPGVFSIKDTDDIDSVKKKILDALVEDNNIGYGNFGLELNSDGDLEEADGGNYWYYVGFAQDWSIIDEWRQRLENNPTLAIDEFMQINPDDWKSSNITAATSIRKIQDYMRAHVDDYRAEAVASASTTPAPPGPAPAGGTGPTVV